MIKQLSFTKYTREILPDFRLRINQAESEEELRNVFFQASKALFDVFLANNPPCEPLDIRLEPESRPYFSLSRRLTRDRNFHRIWENSDLAAVMGRMAETAANRWRHLGTHQEKTTAKIRSHPAGGKTR